MQATQMAQMFKTEMWHMLRAAQIPWVFETELWKLLLEAEMPEMFVSKMFWTMVLLLHYVLSMAMVLWRRT